ncbi:class I SAM-dependent methyltransferase [Boseaceae bacterium BT-24-1]|nr:class I SAM-dependent methyltransferase [Boseaceae bacterium BT-24-1]
MTALSPRLRTLIDTLPLRDGMRVLEIGCGPGAAAREIVRRVGGGHVLAIDRSANAIALARRASQAEIAAGRLSLRQVAAEQFELAPGEPPYDLAFAIRVGALDGRHPEAGKLVRRRIAAALIPGGLLYINRGDRLHATRPEDGTDRMSTAAGCEDLG